MIRSPLLWLSLSCLDAPLVAVAWQWIFARNFHQQVTLGARLVLFMTTWCIYLGDRYADARSLAGDRPCSVRQRYCRAHQAAWRGALLLLALVDAVAIVRLLDARLVFVGATLGVVVLAYLVANHRSHEAWLAVPVKELLVGSLFALGTVSALLTTPARAQPGFAIGLALFAALCTLDCVYIAVWERPLDVVQRKTSLATRFPTLERALLPTTGALALACATAGGCGIAPAPLCGVLCASALAVGALHLTRSRLPADLRTALVDLALMGPLVWCSARAYL